MTNDQRSWRLEDYYFVLLLGVLMGYATLGKGIASLGVPPIFIGEFALLMGLLVFLRSGCLVASLAILPSLLLTVAMGWVLLRTLPFLGEYGFDALRDSVTIMYGGFAFIVIALLLNDVRRVNTVVRNYGSFLTIFIPVIPFIFLLSRYVTDPFVTNLAPHFSAYGIPLPKVRSGEVAAHLAGAAVFTLVGFGKLSRSSIILLFATLPIVFLGRSAILAFSLPVMFATVMLGKVRQAITVLAIGLSILGATYTVEAALGVVLLDPRSVSAHQIVENISSIVTRSGEGSESTKQWRLQWWNIIFADTLFGPNFWTGRGFGLNLGDADGFRDGDHPDLPPLRSPHSVHMTLLARAGVPGLTLWALFLISWLHLLGGALFSARRQGHAEWAGLFLFIGCYVMAIVIDASFDVALEGPMLGIWFWCLIGFGIGSVMIYRASPTMLRQGQTDEAE